MNFRSDRIPELDLLAFADGLLEDDPDRKAAVEIFLRSNPSAREFVHEVRQQNTLIRKICVDQNAGPAPESLRATVWKKRQPWLGANLAKAASLAVALAAAGLLGYLYDEIQPRRPSLSTSFLDTVTLSQNAVSTHPLPLANGTTQAGPHEKKLWLAFPAPDLSSEGYQLVSRKDSTNSQQNVVRLIYRNANAKTVNIFMQPSQNMARSRVEVRKSGNTTKHFMSFGPMTIALTTDAEDLDADRIAHTVENSVQGLRFTKPESTIAASVDGTSNSTPLNLMAPTLEN